MAARNISIRLSVEEAAQVGATLKSIGDDGKAALHVLKPGTGHVSSAVGEVVAKANAAEFGSNSLKASLGDGDGQEWYIALN